MTDIFSRIELPSVDAAGRLPLRRIGVAIGLGATAALVAVPVWPGIFTVDSQAMYTEAADGRINNWYSPVCQALWGVAARAGLPPETALLLQLALVVGGLFALYRLVFRTWPALLLTAATVLVPPLYGFLGWVGRDVWLAGLTLCSLAALAWIPRANTGRWALALVAVLAAWFAADARQNGFPVLLVVGGAALYLIFDRRVHGRLVRVAAAGALVLVALASLLVAQRAVERFHDYPDQPLLYQDLLAVSLRLNESQLSKSIFPSQDLSLIRRTWIPGSEAATIYPANAPVLFRPFENGGRVEAIVRHDWFRMVERHPLAYVHERVALHLLQLAVRKPTQYAFFTSSDTIAPISVRFRQRFPGVNTVRLGYMHAAGGHIPSSGVIFRIWPYALIGMLASIALLFVGVVPRLLSATMLVLQVLLQAVLLFTAPQVELRFEGFQLLLGVASLVLFIGGVVVRRRLEAGSPA